MFSSSPLDWAVVLAYFGFLAWVWLRARTRRIEALDYLVAGRRVTLPAFVATLVASWYGGILGVGEYSYRHGVSNWLVFGVPYYLGALLFALFFAVRARRVALYTIPDLLDRSYGRGPALFGALVVFLTSAPAAYVLVLGTLFSAMTGLPLAPCVLAAAALSLFYVDKGGLRAVVLTDQVQFVLMFAGFALLLGFLAAEHGALPLRPGALPATHLSWNGGNPTQAIVVWYFIALSTLIDPGFWQRAYAARDPGVARRGVLWSIAFWIAFDLMTTSCGLYARALLPNLADPMFAFPELARISLPSLALGLFYAGMIATVMSTIDSYGFIAATTIGRDFIWRLRRETSEERIPFYTRLGIGLSIVVATALALARPSVVGLWHDLGSVTTPALLVPVGAALLGRSTLRPGWALASMAVPFTITLLWVLAHAFPLWPGRTPAYPGSIEPIYPGLVSALAVYALGRALSRKGTSTMNASKKLTAAALVVALSAGAAATARAASADRDPAAADTLSRVVDLPEVVVSTARAGDRIPVARSTLGRGELRERNWGEDTPMVLASLPGAYAYSDAGNGIGYSYLSIRGFPQRRISVLVNGVPLNDPESHEVYWIDHPDLLASTVEVQLQRGVGSALYGAASLGGSVNLETSPFRETPGIAASLTYGSYETKRLMLEMSSGRLANGWNLYGRYSRIETFGYRDASWSKLWSYALSARKSSGDHSFRVNLYGGPEETHLAYLGVPREYLDGAVSGDADRDRRFNPITYPNERDHFFEPHYELIHSWAPSRSVTLSQTLFYFDGKGYYDEQRFGRNLADYRLALWFTADTLAYPDEYFARDAEGNPVRDAEGRKQLERFDLVRRRTVENRHYGWVPRVRWEHAGGAITVGGELRAHDGRHWGEVLSGDGLPPGTPPSHTYYDYHPRTLAGGLFVREEWRLAPQVTATGDLGWRHQSYAMRRDRFDGIRFDQDYDFAVPRLGLTWTPRADAQLFASWAHSSREPAFRDLYDAEGAGSVPLYRVRDVSRNAYEDPLIRPEKVQDWEFGAAWRGPTAAASVNLFHMRFRDELVYAGQFNTDLGYPILGNAARSVHQGVELAARGERALAAGLQLGLEANATLSDNHFQEYREVYGTTVQDVVSYDGNAIGFFPAVLGNLSGRLSWRNARIGADVRHVGRIYLDNTETRWASIDPRTVLDLTAGWRTPAAGSTLELSFRVQNALDAEYATGGYMDYDSSGALAPQFIPAAQRNYLAQVRLDF